MSAHWRKIGKAYRMLRQDGTALWVRRDQRSHRYDLIHAHQDELGRRAVTVLGTRLTLKQAQAKGLALVEVQA